MKYKVIKQPDEKNCGVACLAMICAYYGMPKMSLAIIRDFAKTDKEGNSLYSLKVAAEKLHLVADAYEVEKEDLLNNEVKLPAIVHTVVDGLYEHYMVLFEVNSKRVVLGDPAIGQINMSWENFEKIWTGNVMELEPTENFKENKKYQRNYKIIVSLILKYKKSLLELLVISIIISAISMLTAKFYSYIVDNIIPNNNLKMLVQLLLFTLGIYFFTIFINWIQLKVTIKLNKELDKELIVSIYNRMINLPMTFFSSRTSGDLASRFEDGDTLRSLVTGFTVDFVIDLVYAVFAIIVICINHSWQIALLTLIMLELVVLIQYIFKSKMTELSQKTIKADSEIYSYANASFMGSETIKNYNSEQIIEDTMLQKYKIYQDSMYKGQKFCELQEDLVSTITQITNLFMLTILGILVMRGKITIGELMYLYTLVDYISGPIDYLIDIQDQMYETNAALERLDDVFRTNTEKEINKSRKNLNEKITSIQFMNVYFQYGLRDPILKNISFDIKDGESIGIIGTSGSGKTTIIKLILDFYEATEGKIYINNTNIKDITTSSIRKKIAYVSQNDFWFQDTIFNNLTLGNRQATSEYINKILDIVQMKEYIASKPHGLNTFIEEGATNLSTGEKQRLSLAKALITNPDVLILDESTSNLDAQTEALIVNSLAKEKDKIKIIIAHRLNTLSICDKIISIEDGTIVEMGKPQELLKKGGMFYNLWKTQNQIVNLKRRIGENKNAKEKNS